MGLATFGAIVRLGDFPGHCGIYKIHVLPTQIQKLLWMKATLFVILYVFLSCKLNAWMWFSVVFVILELFLAGPEIDLNVKHLHLHVSINHLQYGYIVPSPPNVNIYKEHWAEYFFLLFVFGAF